MKRNKKEEKKRAFLRKLAQENENWQAQRNLGYIELEVPIHYGFNADWVLRDDVARRDDAYQFESIISKFSIPIWCRKGEFKQYSHFGKLIDRNPGFKKISEKEYEDLLPWEKKFFYSDRFDNVSRWGNVYKYYHVYIPSHYLVKKITKNYKTHYQESDEILLQEEAEIKGELEYNFYDLQRKHWNRHSSIKSWKKIFSRRDRAYNKMALRKNMNTEFAKYDDINDDWGSWLYDWCDDFCEFKYHHKHYGKWELY